MCCQVQTTICFSKQFVFSSSNNNLFFKTPFPYLWKSRKSTIIITKSCSSTSIIKWSKLGQFGPRAALVLLRKQMRGADLSLRFLRARSRYAYVYRYRCCEAYNRICIGVKRAPRASKDLTGVFSFFFLETREKPLLYKQKNLE